MKKLIAFICVTLLSAACTSGKYHSYTDPGFNPSQSYKIIMVQAINFDLLGRETAERYAKRRLEAYTGTAYRHLDVFPPTRSYTKKEFLETIEKLQIDAILVLSLTSEGVSTSYIPQTTYGGYVTTGTVSTYGNTSYLNMTTTPPVTSGGFSVAKPKASYEGVLFDAITGQKIWLSSVSLKGNAFSNYNKLAAKAGDNIVKRLARDRLIVKNQIETKQQ